MDGIPEGLGQTATCLQEVRTIATVSQVVFRTAVSIGRRARKIDSPRRNYTRECYAKKAKSGEFCANCLRCPPGHPRKLSRVRKNRRIPL